MRVSTFAPLPTVKVTRLHSRSLGIPDCEGEAAVPFLETLWGLSYLWPAPVPPNIMQEICMCFCTQLLYPSPILALHGDLGRRGKQLCVDTLCKTKKPKSCIVPEIHELFKHSQVCCLNHCTNFHLLTYTKNRDEQWLRRCSAHKAPAPPRPQRHRNTNCCTKPARPQHQRFLPLCCPIIFFLLLVHKINLSGYYMRLPIYLNDDLGLWLHYCPGSGYVLWGRQPSPRRVLFLSDFYCPLSYTISVTAMMPGRNSSQQKYLCR